MRASDVLRHCGRPTAEGIRVSEVTGLLERNLWYGDNILHFEAAEGDWEFTTGWKGHLPISDKALATHLPCLRAAMNDAKAIPAPLNYNRIDHETRPENASRGLGIPFFWLILTLSALILFVAVDPLLKPSRTRRPAPTPEIERNFRKPQATWPLIDRRKTPRLPPIDHA